MLHAPDVQQGRPEIRKGRSSSVKTNVRRSNLKKRRVSGFLARNRSRTGRKVLRRRRRRGRTATVFG
jgi:ribosomal protein L34